jgi:hypothetical protein
MRGGDSSTGKVLSRVAGNYEHDGCPRATGGAIPRLTAAKC